MSYNFGKRTNSQVDMEKFLNERLENLATKQCIQKLTDLIESQNEEINQQNERISALEDDISDKNKRIEVLESTLLVVQNIMTVLKRDRDNDE